ncbi:sulfotransferase family protein [Pseudomonas triticifolii]|uniref:Sulfotransferase family protein n=1 Tax=Pseudomonas triticifolii TaxID=2762592 RepID=A0ABR7B936_9PSED|nr:sulfotransferase [Pseudomonas triticifolii]MBC3953688.1 hypothetical protein [Pseudomonas triticifolii]
MTPTESNFTRAVFASSHRKLLRADEVEPPHLQGWYPILANAEPQGLWWRYLGEQPFSDAFFSETLQDQPAEQRQRCFTGFSALEALPEGLPLSAFILHVSRCGSTLMTQMLTTLPQCVALSEPPVIDSLLHMHRQGGLDRETCINVLRGLIRSLGQQRDPRQTHLFIKLDCWQLQDLELIREAFPEVPLLFLYREPLQVLASHRRQRGPQMLPGMLDSHWVNASTEHAPGDFDIYCLLVLSRFMQVALDATRQQQLELLNYRELPQVMPERLLDRFALQCSATEREQMILRASRHAKDNQPFKGDAQPDFILGAEPDQALLDQVQGLYEALEQLRRG